MFVTFILSICFNIFGRWTIINLNYYVPICRYSLFRYACCSFSRLLTFLMLYLTSSYIETFLFLFDIEPLSKAYRNSELDSWDFYAWYRVLLARLRCWLSLVTSYMFCLDVEGLSSILILIWVWLFFDIWWAWIVLEVVWLDMRSEDSVVLFLWWFLTFSFFWIFEFMIGGSVACTV